FGSRVGVVIEEEAKKHHLIIAGRAPNPDAKDRLGGAVDAGRRSHIYRFDPAWRTLRARTCGWMLAQIDPCVFGRAWFSCAAFFARQTIAKGFLSESGICCADQPNERNDADQHLAAKIMLVRPKLQAMCRFKYCRKNTVNNQPHD